MDYTCSYQYVIIAGHTASDAEQCLVIDLISMCWILEEVHARYITSRTPCKTEEPSDLGIGVEAVCKGLKNLRKVLMVVLIPPRIWIQ